MVFIFVHEYHLQFDIVALFNQDKRKQTLLESNLPGMPLIDDKMSIQWVVLKAAH